MNNTLKDRLNKKEKKRFKVLSFWDKLFLNKKKFTKPRKVAVIYLRKNNIAELLDRDTQRGFFEIEGKTYHINRDCLFTLGKDRIPLGIIEEDGLVPKGNAGFYNRINDVNAFEKFCSEYQDLMLKAIRHEESVKLQSRDGSKIDPKAAIGLAIAGIILFAILRSQF